MPGTRWDIYSGWDNVLDACDYKCRCKRACEADISCPQVLAACREACKKKKKDRPQTGWDFYQSQPYAVRQECESAGMGIIEHDAPPRICSGPQDCNALPGAEPSLEPGGKNSNTAIYIAFAIIIISLTLYLILS